MQVGATHALADNAKLPPAVSLLIVNSSLSGYTVTMNRETQNSGQRALAGRVTRLQIQKKNKERTNVYLDGEYAFSLALSLALGLQKGQELSATEVKALQAEDEIKRAYAAALHFLGYRARSVTEVEQRLQRREFGERAIAQTVERLQREGYLNDSSFGHAWVESRLRSSPRGSRALRHELRRKGLETEIIDEVLETVEIDEEAAAWAAIEAKLDRWRALEKLPFQQKVGSFLARRGFGYEIVRPVVERAWNELHPESSSFDPLD